MNLYLAGTTVSKPDDEPVIQRLFQRGHKLHSYFHSRPKGFEQGWFNMNCANKVDLFLDSGAFSAFTQGVQIDINEYIQFINEHRDVLTVYANLDVIGDPAGTLANQKIMEAAGLDPLPCFHYGEPISYLLDYINEYDYIALGGMVPISTPNLLTWLDDIFGRYICDEHGMPKVRIHGFGLTSLRLMLRYPWYSVDSTSWVVLGRMGSLYVPRFRDGRYVYDEDSWKVSVSSRSPNRSEAGQHIETFPPRVREIILDYIYQKGYKLGLSEFKTESDKYELRDGEKWSGKAEAGQREVEIILEPGLSNQYKLRDEINIMYFLDLEKSMPEWPWPFCSVIRDSAGFDL